MFTSDFFLTDTHHQEINKNTRYTLQHIKSYNQTNTSIYTQLVHQIAPPCVHMVLQSGAKYLITRKAAITIHTPTSQ